MFGISSYVSLMGLRLHVERRSGTGRALVMVHGLSDSAACFSRVVQSLPPDYDIIAYDLRGHGLSDAPDEGYGPKDHARDLLGLLDALEVQRPVVIGHSLGAETAAVASTLAPGRIDRLVLEDPPWVRSWIDTTPDERRASVKDWMSDVATLKSLTLEEAWLKARRDNTVWSDDELRPWLESKLQLRMVAFESVAADHDDWRTVVDRIPCQTLLLSGDVAKGGLVTEEVGQQAAVRNPRIRWVQLPEAGHCIHRDRLDAYLELVGKFLQAQRSE